MKNETKRKNRKFIFSLLIGLVVAFSGLSAYAMATGQMPQVLKTVASVFAGNNSDQIVGQQAASSSQNTASDSGISPSEINPTDSINHNSSLSSAALDPDAKVDAPIRNQGNTNVEPLPITITPVTTSTSSKPAAITSSKAPATSNPISSTPSKPSAPESTVSSQPSSSSSSTQPIYPPAPPQISGVTLDKTNLTLNKGDVSDKLIPTISPSNATGDKTITWISSNDTIATVDITGHVTAVGPGTTQIFAKTSNGKTSICTVTVLIPATAININSENFSIDKGSSKSLTATLTPADSTDQITWATSNSDIVTVDNSGKTTAESPGSAIISASVGNGSIKAECTVDVVISISSLTLDKAQLVLFKGSNDTLAATIDPPDTTEDKTITWASSDSAVATVDATGKVIAVGGGTAIISATAGTHYCECTVNVVVPVTGVSLNKSDIKMGIGTDETLIATITPEDATNKTVTWSSSDENIATVDGTGKVTAHNVGNAVITATSQDGGFTAQCNVTVVIPVQGVSLDKIAVLYIRGTSGLLTAIINPVDATDQAVTWSSSETSIASVDSAGHVTAVGAGTAVITVTTHDGAYTAQCSVTVIVPINSITLNQTTAELRVEKNMSLSVSIDPLDTTEDKTVMWSSSDNSIATVDTQGNVTGINSGNVVITAQIGTHVASCTVTVKPKITATIVNPTDLTAGGHGTYVNSNGHIAITLKPSGNVGSYGDAYGHSVWVENTKGYQIKIKFSEPIELVSNVATFKGVITTSGGDVTYISNNGTPGEGPWKPRITCTGWGYGKESEHVYTRQPDTLLAYLQPGWGTTANLNYIYGGGYENNNTPTQTVSEISIYIYNEDIYHPSSDTINVSFNSGDLIINGIPVIF